MDRLTRFVPLARFGLIPLVALLALAVSCGPEKVSSPARPLPSPLPSEPSAEVFPVPYLPSKPVPLYGWEAAVIYSPELLDDRQQALVARLEPAGGEGEVALGFTRDFDGDGLTETVSYGAFENAGVEGNFVLVVRDGAPPMVLLKKELPGPARFTVFTLKPDGSLWFGGGIEDGEVTMNLTWEAGMPVFRHLTAD